MHNLDLSTELNLAAQIIRKDINDGIKSGKDIFGNSFKPLKASTVKAKRKKGYAAPSKPLYATGTMKNTLPITGKNAAKKSLQRSLVEVAKSRQEIGVYHNAGDGVPQRPWFGVSDRAVKKIRRMLRKQIANLMRKKS